MEGCECSIRKELEKTAAMEKMTPAQMERALIEISDEEMLQVDRPLHTQLIADCHSLVFQMNGKAFPSEQKMTESCRRVCRSIEKRLKTRAAMRIGFQTAAMLLLVFFASLVFDAAVNRNLLHGETSENGEEYRIEGHQAAHTLIAQGSADGRVETLHLSTRDLAEVTEALGSVPELPSWLPEGWQLNSYYLISTNQIQNFSAKYEHPDYHDYLVYSSRCYRHPEYAAISFEQDTEGVYEYWGDQRVYLTSNMGYHVAIWVEGKEENSVSGPLPFEELRKFYDSIGKEDEKMPQ